MKKNGFTLIELLAVIVILAVIALITVPAVMNVVADAKASAAKDAAYGYIKAVELSIALENADEDTTTAAMNYASGSEFTVSSVAVKGSKPSAVKFIITNGEVISGTITVAGHDVTIAGGVVTGSVAD